MRIMNKIKIFWIRIYDYTKIVYHNDIRKTDRTGLAFGWHRGSRLRP